MDKEISRITVGNLCLVDEGEWIKFSVLLTASHLNWDKKKLWYRFPNAYSNFVTTRYDPFLAALLPLAMKTHSNLILKGAVSERLLINSRQIMKILSGWFEYMEPVDIKADSSEPAQSGTKAVGSFFTGGVDSFYTVLKNLESFQNESRITHLIYVHGFDIDINNQHLFGKVKNEIRGAGAELDLKPIFVKTNLREITNQHVRWGEEQHGAALASVALCLQKLFKIVLIPSSVSYSELYKWGTHPLVDPLWSNEHLQIFHDGNEANRSQKIFWQLSNSQIALSYLRVCWKNPDNLYNCGVCGKCIRTKINLKMANVLEQCKTLDDHIDLNRYENILLKSFVERRNLKENIQLIGDTNPELKNMLQSTLHLVTKKRSKLSFKLKRFKEKYF